MKFLSKALLILILSILNEVSFSQNLIAHYPFDDNSAADKSGNKNDGRILGGVTSTADRFGNACGAMNFNGTDGFIEVPNSLSLQSPVQYFSATCWFKITNVPFSNGFRWLTLICKGDDPLETNSNPQYRVQTFQSTIQSTISINTDFTEYDNNFYNHPFEYDKWNFYALVYDGHYVRCYLNDAKIWEFQYSRPLTANYEPLHIGKDIPGDLEFFCGSLDDLRIYNAPLTDAEISQLYNDDTGASYDDAFILTCPDNIAINMDKDKCSAIVNYPQPTLSINCGTASLHQIGGLSTGSQFPVGVSMVTYEASSNSGFKKTCSTKVTVTDKEAPVINCDKDTTILITNITKSTAKYDYQLPAATDNCSVVSVKLTKGLATGNEFPAGTTLLKFQATDQSGNSAECSYNVIVKKNVTPIKKDTLQCPSDIKKFNDSHKCGAIVNYTMNQNQKGIKQLDGAASGDFFKVGSTLNKFGGAANSNIQNECSFNVTVVDNEKPEITCPNDTIVYTNAGERTIRISYTNPSAVDNCSIDTIIQVAGNKSDDLFAVGATQNIFKATDSNGNFATCSFNIIVIDTNPVKKVEPPADTEFKPDLIPDSIRYTKSMDFNTCIITVMMYDDSEQDYDTVSVFFNKKEIVFKELIKLKKNGTINRALMLNPGEKNDFIVKAWNNGNISPNTLKIEFYEGYYLDNPRKLKNRTPDKERTLHSKPGVAAAIYLNCKNQ